MGLETSPAETSKLFILFSKELLFITFWWEISKLLLAFVKTSPRGGCGAPTPAEMSKLPISSMKIVSLRGGGCCATRTLANISKLFILSRNDVWPAEMSKSFIPLIKDASTRGGEYSASLVS